MGMGGISNKGLCREATKGYKDFTSSSNVKGQGNLSF